MFSLCSPKISSPQFLLDLTNWSGEELNFPPPGLQRTIQWLSYRKEVFSFQLLPNSPRGSRLMQTPPGEFQQAALKTKARENKKTPHTTIILPKKKKPKQKLIKISSKYNYSRELQESREGRLKVESPQFITRPSLAPQVAVGLLNDYIYNLKFPPTWNWPLGDGLPYASRPMSQFH